MKKILLLTCLFIPCLGRELRWGILSTARFNDKIIEALRQSKKSKLVAVASRSLEKAQRYAQKRDIPVAYGSYEDLLVDPTIDVIFNPLPNSMHAEWTIKAVKAGKHVLCEKPLVTSLEDFEELEQALKVHNKIVLEGLAYIYHPQTNYLMSLLQEKKIGEISTISSWLQFNVEQPSKDHMKSKNISEEIRL